MFSANGVLGILTGIALAIPGWILFGYAGGWIAAKKGYPPRAGVVWGAIGGPVALLISLILPMTEAGHAQVEHERRLARELEEDREKKTCPGCGEQLTIRAVICGHCEHRF